MTQTIYVALVDEGTDVWRPVEAVLVSPGAYRILSLNADPDIETWEFSTNDVVRCEERRLASGEALVAVCLAVHAA